MRLMILTAVVLIQLSLNAQGYICAVGGEAEYNNWSDASYSWIVQKSGYGKIIVLSVNDETAWMPNYFMSFGADTAYNKKINSRTIANSSSTYNDLITAKAIFIKGGDQWNYINYWKGTKTEDAIYYVFNHGGVIGGTSAGEAILGEVDFSAQNGSAYPKDCLLNPFNSTVALEDNFVNLIPGVLFDSHFIERGRFGRLIPFLVNAHFVKSRDLLGVGVDGRTALCIDTNRIGKVMGEGAVSFYQIDYRTNLSRSGNNYTATNLKCDQLTDGWEFDFKTKSISYIPPSARNVDTSRNWAHPSTDLWLTGINNVQTNVNISLSSFLSTTNVSKILVIYNPGYASSLTPLTNYLNSQSYNYSTLGITTAGLNYTTNKQKIDSATSFIFLGDSLSVLSKLKDQSTLCGAAFYNKISTLIPSIYFAGNAGKISGANYVDNLDSDGGASLFGLMTNNSGLNVFGDLIFQPMIWDNSTYYENRSSAVFWGLMRNRKRIGIFLDGNDYALISKNNKVITSFGPSPILVVDARNTTKVDSSKFIHNSGSHIRQSVAMNELRFSLSTINKKYSLEKADIVSTINLTALIEGFYNESVMVPDTVTVELHNASSPYALVDQAKVVLNASGVGTANFFSVIEATPYYIVVKHRNSINTWSKTTQSFSIGTLNYNFTSDSTKAYGDNMKKKGTKWCILSGDVNRDGVVDLSDIGNVDVDNLNFITGYTVNDLNGDDLVDLSDLSIVDANSLNFVTIIVPAKLFLNRRNL